MPRCVHSTLSSYGVFVFFEIPGSVLWCLWLITENLWPLFIYSVPFCPDSPSKIPVRQIFFFYIISQLLDVMFCVIFVYFSTVFLLVVHFGLFLLLYVQVHWFPHCVESATKPIKGSLLSGLLSYSFPFDFFSWFSSLW